MLHPTALPALLLSTLAAACGAGAHHSDAPGAEPSEDGSATQGADPPSSTSGSTRDPGPSSRGANPPPGGEAVMVAGPTEDPGSLADLSAGIQSAWYAFDMPVLDSEENATHMGRLLADAPAGKHGHVRVEGEHFVFEDGTRFRAWGTNIDFAANLPPKNLAPKVADRLAKLGYNMVRFQNLDTAKGLFGQGRGNRELNQERLDRFDYFASELKKRGIYWYVGLYCWRSFQKGDPIPEPTRTPRAGKWINYIHPDVQALQRSYAEKLLGHKNRYTGIRYRDDPALVIVELTNENSLWPAWMAGSLDSSGDGTSRRFLARPYLEQLDKDFNRWLANKYGTRNKLAQAWQRGGRQGLGANEDPRKGTVRRVGAREIQKYSPSRMSDMIRFYYEVERDYFLSFKEFLQDDLGIEAAVLGTQLYTGMPGLLAQSAADFLDTHTYWDHPSFRQGMKQQPYMKVHNLSWVANPEYTVRFGDPGSQTPLQKISMSRVAGKPFTVSEWQASKTNPYEYEVPLLFSAYSSYYDLDGLLSFTFAMTEEDYQNGPLGTHFIISNNPAHCVLNSVAALAYRRGDVRPTQEFLTLHYSEREIFENLKNATRDNLLWWGRQVPTWVPYVVPVRRDMSEGGRDSGPHELLSKRDPRRYVANTGELVWDAQSKDDAHVLIQTPRLQGVVGSLNQRVGELPNLDLNGRGKATVALISLDGAALRDTERALLVAVGQQRADGESVERDGDWMVWDKGRGRLKLETVPVTVRLRELQNRDRLKVYALDGRGRRSEQLATEAIARDGLRFVLGEHRSPWFELATD